MDRYHLSFPQYGFDKNRGYPTPEHLEALGRNGVCVLHRRTFAPVRRILEAPARLPF
jgi:ribonuclease HII